MQKKPKKGEPVKRPSASGGGRKVSGDIPLSESYAVPGDNTPVIFYKFSMPNIWTFRMKPVYDFVKDVASLPGVRDISPMPEKQHSPFPGKI